MPVKTDREYRAMPLLTPTAASSRRLLIQITTWRATHHLRRPLCALRVRRGAVQGGHRPPRPGRGGPLRRHHAVRPRRAGLCPTGKSNTLIVEPQERGLFMAADLSRTEQARSMHEDIAAGLVTRCPGPSRSRRTATTGRPTPGASSRSRRCTTCPAVSFPANPSHQIIGPFLARRSDRGGKSGATCGPGRRAKKEIIRILLEV